MKNPEVKIGDTIKILHMVDEPEYKGRSGVVEDIDSLGTLHGTWGGLGVIVTADKFEIIKDE